MRRTAIAALACCLMASAAAAQKASRPYRNVLVRYLDRASIHPPAKIGSLTVFPVCLSTVNRLDGVLTMDQALAKKLLVIDEMKDARVSQARFVNKSGDKMIFLMAGEVITGGKQNRTLTSDALLAPDSATVLELYCVQQGRWTGQANFGGPTTVAPLAVRATAAGKAGQRAVWGEVAKANRRMKTVTARGDLAAAMSKPENVQRLARFRKPINAKLPKDCVGVVVADGSSIVAADLFNTPDLFAAMKDKVLNSYLSQYEDDKLTAAGATARPSQEDVRSYLQACYKARFSPADTRGVGKLYTLSGARTGQTLAHARGGAVNVKPRRADDWMVHTALMEKIVPVKPVKRPPVPVRPVPMPRPPRPMPQPRRLPQR
jgi:hypothetical protein